MKCPKCQTVNPIDSKFCKECATPLPSAAKEQVSFTRTLETTSDELVRGTVFAGRYEIIEKLGAGGMGYVYRAFDKKLDEEIALKFLKPEIAADKRTVERFRNEIKVARKISHKNVCRMHDLHEEGKTLFLTMEYVRGEDLKSLIHRTKALAVGSAVSYAHQIAEGLGEAHKLGITHRDLKPGNIMIDKEGQAKVMDFGIARVRQEKGVTGEGAVIGTPEYMSPEQVDGIPADQRADIYALGVILFEMVTGRPPFEGESALAVAHKHKYEPAPDPRTLNPQLPIALGRLILRSMEKEREKRYQTTAELLADLETVEAALPSTERLPGRAPSRTKPAASKTITVKITPRRLLIPAAALIALIAIVIVMTSLLRRKEPALASVSPDGVPSVAILIFKNNTGDEKLDGWKEELCTSLIIKLSQSRFFRVVDLSQIYGILKRLNLAERENYTPDDLRAIASGVMATHIVQGSFSKAGERIRINLSLRNAATQEIIAPDTADGMGEQSIYDLIDDLGARLKSNLGLTSSQRASDFEREIGDITASPEAFKFYVQGYQFYSKAQIDQAIESFKRAVAADPQFAMAYLFLGIGNFAMGMFSDMRPYLQKAFDLRSGVSERERLLIEAEYYQLSSEKTWGKAIQAFSDLLRLYPWDPIATADLGFTYWKMDEWDEAIKRYETLRRYKFDLAGPYQILTYCYLSKGRPDKAREVLEWYLTTFGDSAFIRAILGWIDCIEEDYVKAGTEIEKAFALAPESTWWFKYSYLLCIGDFVSAEQVIQGLETQPPDTFIGLRIYSLALQGKIKEAAAFQGLELEKWQASIDPIILALVLLDYAALLDKTGDYPGALSACERALRKARESGDGISECLSLYRRGIIQAQAGDLGAAERSAEELGRTVEGGLAKKRFRYVEGLLGAVALQKKSFAGAREHLLKALSLTSIEDGYVFNPRSEFLDYLAQAYIQEGRWTEAKGACEDIVGHRLRSLCGSASGAIIHARSHYQLGLVLERLGDKAGAAKNYRKLLDLWKDADPGLPEVEDAKKRLAALS